MDGTMVHIREEGWKELKVGCVFDIAQRQYDPHAQEELELGSAIHNSYVAPLGGLEVFGRQLWTEARHRFWAHAEYSLTLGDGATRIWNLVSEHFLYQPPIGGLVSCQRTSRQRR